MRRARTVACAWVAALQCACLAAVSPSPGKPVIVGAGEALVFGRIRVTRPEFARSAPGEFLEMDGLLTLELRGLRPPGGAVKWATKSSPEVDDDGAFHWILATGDYVLACYPRGTRIDPAQATILARFSVPPGVGTVYVGALEVVVRVPEPSPVGLAIGAVPDAPVIVNYHVTVEGELAFATLRARYPSVPAPIATAPMTPGSQ